MKFLTHSSHSSWFLLYVRGPLWRLAGERIITGLSLGPDWTEYRWQTVNSFVYVLCLSSAICWNEAWLFWILFSQFSHYFLFCGSVCFDLVQHWSCAVMLLQGLLVRCCQTCVLLIPLPCYIILSIVLVTFCGQYHSPVPCGVVCSLSVPQHSSLWCDQHVVGWPVVRHLAGRWIFFHTSLRPNAV